VLKTAHYLAEGNSYTLLNYLYITSCHMVGDDVCSTDEVNFSIFCLIRMHCGRQAIKHYSRPLIGSDTWPIE